MTAEAVGWRNRILRTADVAPAELVANPENWRTHPSGQAAALEGLLGEVGWVTGVIVNERTGHLVDGHLRVERAIEQGEATVPVTYVDLSPEEERLVLASLDPIGDMADRNRNAFEALVSQVRTGDDALRRLLAELRPAMGGFTDVDEVRPLPADLRVGPGEIWALGDHRLACGDSTDPVIVGRLLEGLAPRLLSTDPPYGVAFDPTWRDRAGYNSPENPSRDPYMIEPRGKVRGHGLGDAGGRTISGDTRADWSAAFELVPSLEVGYVWHAAIYASEVVAGLRRVGFELVGQVIWDKVQFTMGRSWYHWAHEPCWVVRRPGHPHLFHGPKNQATVWHAAALAQGDVGHPATCCLHQSDIWAVPSPLKQRAGSKEEATEHPTQKPVVLSQIPITNHLAPGEWVYDPFLGSGTTLIAAETLGRRCAGRDRSPVRLAHRRALGGFHRPDRRAHRVSLDDVFSGLSAARWPTAREREEFLALHLDPLPLRSPRATDGRGGDPGPRYHPRIPTATRLRLAMLFYCEMFEERSRKIRQRGWNWREERAQIEIYRRELLREIRR